MAYGRLLTQIARKFCGLDATSPVREFRHYGPTGLLSKLAPAADFGKAPITAKTQA